VKVVYHRLRENVLKCITKRILSFYPEFTEGRGAIGTQDL